MPESEDVPLDGPLRRCIVTGEVKPKSELMRFVVGPDGNVVPDIAGTLPGRGLWVTPTRTLLETAIKKRLFSRANKGNARADDVLITQVEALMRARLLSVLGLLRRQGRLVAGFEKTRSLLASGKAALWIEAHDGAEDGRGKLAPLARNVPCLTFFSRLELARALGREDVVHAAAEKSPNMPAIHEQMRRLTGFIE